MWPYLCLKSCGFSWWVYTSGQASQLSAWWSPQLTWPPSWLGLPSASAGGRGGLPPAWRGTPEPVAAWILIWPSGIAIMPEKSLINVTKNKRFIVLEISWYVCYLWDCFIFSYALHIYTNLWHISKCEMIPVWLLFQHLWISKNITKLHRGWNHIDLDVTRQT